MDICCYLLHNLFFSRNAHEVKHLLDVLQKNNMVPKFTKDLLEVEDISGMPLVVFDQGKEKKQALKRFLV